ncbi:MAG: amino acid ABC transporter substrate-binding protein [Betaproteobacteria bacterium]
MNSSTHLVHSTAAIALLILTLLLGNQIASAQANKLELNDTLKKAGTTGVISVGYREFSVPFSFLSTRNEPIGYSIDLCRSIVDAISKKVGRELTIKWERVTSETRMDAVLSGQVDLECGSTTNNAERSKRLAFSPIIFVAGTKLMVKRSSSIKTFRDLSNKVVVVTAGTTNEKAMHDLRDKFRLNYAIVAGHDHEESYDLLIHGEADAFATDNVLLNGLIAKNKLNKDYLVTGDFLSYDPYGIMYRKNDPALKRLVETTFYAMAEERELDRVYDKWFMRRLPSGDSIDLPMSPHLETIFRSMGTKPE